MVEQAVVLVRNKFKKLKRNVEVRYEISGRGTGTNTPILPGEKRKLLLSTDGALIIEAPGDKDKDADTRDCGIWVQSDVDLIINYSRSKSFWKMRVESSDLPPTVPADVNINIGENEPEP